jgi:hypothetical protein
MRPEFNIYPGKTNSVQLELSVNGAIINHIATTRLRILVGSVWHDSNTTPSLFDLTKTDYVEIKLGATAPALSAGIYTCLIAIDNSSIPVQDFVWPVEFTVIVTVLPP